MWEEEEIADLIEMVKWHFFRDGFVAPVLIAFSKDPTVPNFVLDLDEFFTDPNKQAYLKSVLLDFIKIKKIFKLALIAEITFPAERENERPKNIILVSLQEEGKPTIEWVAVIDKETRQILSEELSSKVVNKDYVFFDYSWNQFHQ
ncbi:MAG: hypothetical protein QXG39_02805 [Candidatus Aenigmatarchaeota archaeon]